MKLFNVTKAVVPENRKPDYDRIKQLERLNENDEQGFDERFDGMLFDFFFKVQYNPEWDYEVLIEMLHDLVDSMFSTKYRLMVYDRISKVKAERRHENLSGSGRSAVDALRARMVARGKRRHD